MVEQPIKAKKLNTGMLEVNEMHTITMEIKIAS
jgi:hypothetical protein